MEAHDEAPPHDPYCMKVGLAVGLKNTSMSTQDVYHTSRQSTNTAVKRADRTLSDHETHHHHHVPRAIS
eukprot:scaffold34470_cov40-Tisochrysis_lutea.AAC.3